MREKQIDDCAFCKAGDEKCGTCVRFFYYHEDGGSDRCSSGCGEEKCVDYKPVHFCPNCGTRMTTVVTDIYVGGREESP